MEKRENEREEREGKGGCEDVQVRLISLWLFGSAAKGNGRTRDEERKEGAKGSRERQVCNRRYHLSAAAPAPGCIVLSEVFTSSLRCG